MSSETSQEADVADTERVDRVKLQFGSKNTRMWEKREAEAPGRIPGLLAWSNRYVVVQFVGWGRLGQKTVVNTIRSLL